MVFNYNSLNQKTIIVTFLISLCEHTAVHLSERCAPKGIFCLLCLYIDEMGRLFNIAVCT